MIKGAKSREPAAFYCDARTREEGAQRGATQRDVMSHQSSPSKACNGLAHLQ